MYPNAFILLKLLTSNYLKEVKDGIPFGMSLTSFILCAGFELPIGSWRIACLTIPYQL